METAIQLRKRQLEMELDWIPRLQNIEADAITKSDFTAFKESNRIPMTAEMLSGQFHILPRLLALGEEFQRELTESKEAREAEKVPEAMSKPWRRRGKKRPASKRLRATDPW